tara:strand:+ start:1508 stop:2047 length:540 start_codon:yes stop_codon:yes gene_type:complete
MKSIKIHGKDYVLVNDRIKEFTTNPKYNDYGLETIKTLDEWFEYTDKKTGEIIQDNRVEFKCIITNASGKTVSNGTARELMSSSYINKTSHIENCETSAVGRALGFLGIGIDTSIASADEVVNAVNNQPEKKEDNRPWLKENQLIATLKGDKQKALNVITAFKMKKEYRTKINKQFNLK